VIPNKNGADLIGRCVEAAARAGASEVLVVDDGSTDASADEAEAAGAVVLPSPGRGFAAAVNAGVPTTKGDVILILNSDCYVEKDALQALTGALAESERIGICGAALLELDGKVSKSHTPALTPWRAILVLFSVNPFTERLSGKGLDAVDSVPLACAAIRRSTWNAVGGLDERFFFYFEDQDLCRRLRRTGHSVAVCWEAKAVHVGGASSVTRDEQRWFLEYVRSRTRYLRKHFPRGWWAFAAVWIPVALAQSAVWALRRRPGADAWARAWLRATRVGITG
jgi:GT2 family glycosyltransferase